MAIARNPELFAKFMRLYQEEIDACPVCLEFLVQILEDMNRANNK